MSATTQEVPAPSKTAELVADDGEELGSEDSDDSEESDSEQVVPFLSGELKVADGHLVWEGKWGMSREKFEAGSSWKLKMRGPACAAASAADGAAAAPARPVSGDFSGYFKMESDEGEEGEVKVEENGVKITFKDPEGGSSVFKFAGRGANNFGAFELYDGQYDPATGVMLCNKRYEADDDDDDDDLLADEAVDPSELDDLNAEANMSIEELRAKYGAGGGDGAGGSGAGSSSAAANDDAPPAKRAKVAVAEDEEDDYEEF